MHALRVLRRCLFLSSVLALSPAAGSAGVLAGNCRVATQPAATLLIPYFSVDLVHPLGRTTLFSLNNASARPALARVVLWTDWGVPTLAFDVYLTGYDVQTINVRDLFHGDVPVTGGAASPVGPLSQQGTALPGCGGTTAAAGAGPQSVGVPLDASSMQFLRAAHTGQPLPPGAAAAGSTRSATSGPACAASGAEGAATASGYITADVVTGCSGTTISSYLHTPADPAYFQHGGAGLASDNNVLWGEVIYLDQRQNQAHSQAAVAVVADPDFFHPGDYTFYGRYVGFDGRDDRMPLSSLYYVQYIDGRPFTSGSDVVVWRDNRIASVAAQPCGKAPSWAPLGENQLVVFDEQENPTAIQHSNAFPLATQKVHVGSPVLAAAPHTGYLMLDLWHADQTHAQAWVGVVMSAGGRFSVGHEATRMDDLCNFGP
jgi:hypothetical protein